MAELYAGTQAVVGTEWSTTNNSSTIAARTEVGYIQPVVDVQLPDGHAVALRIYEKARSADTQRLVERFDVASPGQVVLPALLLMHGWDVTIQRIVGASAVTCNWSLRRLSTPTVVEATDTAAVTSERSVLVPGTPAPQTSEGLIQAFIDVSDMTTDDEVAIRVYEKVRTGDAQKMIYERVLRDAQTRPIWTHPALHVLHGYDVTVEAIAGTVTINSSVRRIAP